MSYSPSSAQGQDALFTAATIVAAVGAIGLAAAQSDFVSRIILSPERLQAKRLQEYAYRWEQAIEKAFLRCQYYLAGGIEEAYRGLEKQSTWASPTMIWDETGLKQLVQDWMKQDKENERGSRRSTGNGKINSKASAHSPFPRILGFSREEESREILIELYNPLSGKYQLPLARMGLVLAAILEETLTSTALCFVADASSGLGSHMLEELLDASKAGVVRKLHAMFVVPNEFEFLRFRFLQLSCVIELGHFEGAHVDGGVGVIGRGTYYQR